MTMVPIKRRIHQLPFVLQNMIAGGDTTIRIVSDNCKGHHQLNVTIACNTTTKEQEPKDTPLLRPRPLTTCRRASDLRLLSLHEQHQDQQHQHQLRRSWSAPVTATLPSYNAGHSVGSGILTTTTTTTTTCRWQPCQQDRAPSLKARKPHSPIKIRRCVQVAVVEHQDPHTTPSKEPRQHVNESYSLPQLPLQRHSSAQPGPRRIPNNAEMPNQHKKPPLTMTSAFANDEPKPFFQQQPEPAGVVNNLTRLPMMLLAYLVHFFFVPWKQVVGDKQTGLCQNQEQQRQPTRHTHRPVVSAWNVLNRVPLLFQAKSLLRNGRRTSNKYADGNITMDNNNNNNNNQKDNVLEALVVGSESNGMIRKEDNDAMMLSV